MDGLANAAGQGTGRRACPRPQTPPASPAPRAGHRRVDTDPGVRATTSSGRLTLSSARSRAGSKASGGAGSSGMSAGTGRRVSLATNWATVERPFRRGGRLRRPGWARACPSPRRRRSYRAASTVDVFSHDGPPGHPLTLGGSNSAAPSRPARARAAAAATTDIPDPPRHTADRPPGPPPARTRPGP